MKFIDRYKEAISIFEAKIDHTEYPKRLRKKSEAELKYIIKDATEAMKANPDSEKSKSGYYADEVNYAVMELNRRKKGGKQEVDEGKNDQEGYKFYVVVDDKIESGWFNKEDAKEYVDGDLPDKYVGKIVAKVSLKKLNLDADTDTDWLGGTVNESRDIKDYIGKYLHKGIEGSSNYEKAVKIKDAKRGRSKGSIKLLIGDKWIDFISNLDHISKSE